MLPQPLPLVATLGALERAKRQRSLRSSGAEVHPGLDTGGGSEEPIAVWTPPGRPPPQLVPRRPSLRTLLARLDAPRPYCDSSNQRLPESLLDRICARLLNHACARAQLTREMGL